MFKKKVRSLIAFTLIMTLVLAGGIVLRNFFLSRLKARIQSIVQFERLHFAFLPLSLVMDNVVRFSGSLHFSARQIRVHLPLASLFKSEKPLTVVIEKPVLRARAGEGRESPAKQPGFPFALPFILEKVFIRGGEFFYDSAGSSFQAAGIQALVQERGDRLSIRTEVKDSSIQLGPERRALRGRVRLRLEVRGNRVKVDRFVWSGGGTIVKARGPLTFSQDPEGTLDVTFKAGMDALAGALGLPFRWEGRVEGEGELVRARGEFTYSTSFESDNLSLNEIPLGRIAGQFEYRPNRGFTVTMNAQRRGSLKSEIKIFSEAGKIGAEWENLALDPVMAYFSLPWPIYSPARGRLMADNRQIAVDLEFREESLLQKDGRFPLRGAGRVTWDRQRALTFSFSRLETSFGQMDIQGKMAIGGDLDFLIAGQYQDIRAAREFTSLILDKKLDFPEVRGEGAGEVRVGGPTEAPGVRLDFRLSPAGFGDFDVTSGQGFVEVFQDKAVGFVQFEDPLYKGEISFASREVELSVEVKLAAGQVESILPRLGLSLPLAGLAAGNFLFQQRGPSAHLEGNFSGRSLRFGSARLDDINGRLVWENGVLSFPELSFGFYGGRVKTAFRLDVPGRWLETSTVVEKIDLSRLVSRLAGQLSFHIQGKGRLDGEFATGRVTVEDFTYSSFQKIRAEGELRVGFAESSLGVQIKGALQPGKNDFVVEAAIPLSGEEISLSGKGSFTNLELFLPWKGARGQINYIAEVRGLPRQPRLEGAVDFEGPVLPFPRFAQALTDYAGLVFLQNNRVSLRSFRARLGGGEVKGSGEVQLGRGGVNHVRLTLEGEDLLLAPLERVRAQADASLALVKDGEQFVLEGNFDIKRLFWRREIFEAVKFSSSPYPQAEKSPGLFDDLTLNLRLKADDSAWMENSLGRIRGRFDLTVVGSVQAPILLGEIEALGGEAYFQDRKFDVLRGRVSFFNPTRIEPYLNFRGETHVKDYRVTLTLTGLVSQLKPEFSSSPPLPPEDVLALLALGEAFRRPYSAETSSQLGTASLLSFQLTEEAQKRAERLFSLDRFRIDPFLMGTTAEMTARLTIGKKISRDFYIYYSTNLTRQMEEVIRLEWDLGNEFSLVGTRNELGRVSLDFKIRKRF